MIDSDRTECFRISLLLTGLIFIAGIYPLTILSLSILVLKYGPAGILADDSGIYAILGGDWDCATDATHT
jgi:hypothetical protein